MSWTSWRRLAQILSHSTLRIVKTRYRCQNKPHIYSSQWWSVELPNGWSYREENECTSFYANGANGVLQISAVRKPDSCVGMADVREFSEQANHRNSEMHEVHSKNYFGLSCKYEKGDRYWAEWWLAHGQILVYITYNADVGKQDSEIREIQLIGESLRIRGALSPS